MSEDGKRIDIDNGKSGNAGFSASKKLLFDVKNGPGIRIEPTERFRDSFFRDNYYDALVLTDRIIEENEKFTENPEFAESSQYRLYNIISFLGGRGTGKTSVMDSVVLALRDRSRRAEYVIFGEDYQSEFIWNRENAESANDAFDHIKKADFICLDEIDASLLEKNENILDVVLAKMLQYFQKETALSRKSYWTYEKTSFRKEDIYAAFEEIYHYWHNLLDRRGGTNSISSNNLEVMRELSGSLHIREKLASLVKYYRYAIRDERYSDKPENVYLIIRIDDLDLNPDCYEMLEQIHRYLMIPGVIIYFAASARELQDVCRKHFENHYSKAKELATDYLDKVLTTSRRIYMPTLINENVLIEPDQEDVKKTILWKIGRRTRVFFDGCGYKKHFYEEDNLRALLNLYYGFESMEKLESDSELLTNPDSKKLYMLVFERNIDKLYDDVTKRLAMEKLDNADQNTIFREYCHEDSARRGRYFYEWLEENYRKRSEDSGYLSASGVSGNFGNQSKVEYNYGELMRSINHFGREYKSLKPLLHCVLAEYSVTLTKLYYRMRFSEDKQKRAKYKSKFLECISGSVIGSWAFKLLPQIKRSSMMDITSIGYEEAFRLCGTIKLGDYGIHEEGLSRYELSKKLLNNNTINFVQTIELMGMFLTKIQKSMGVSQSLLVLEGGKNRPSDGENHVKLPSYVKPEGNTPLQLRLTETTCTFDILGFVLVGINAKAYFDQVEDRLMEMFRLYWEDNYEYISKEDEDEIRNMIRQKSMRSAYDEWAEQYGELALPVYSLDMMYNITKRVKTEVESRRIGDDYKENLIDSVKDCYELYLNNLTDETEYFSKLLNKEGNEKSCDVNFAETLRECPFYKNFTSGIKANAFLRDVFKEILWGEIEQSSVDMGSSMEEAEWGDTW